MPIGDDYENFPAVVATALNQLRDEGVDGPYAIALGEECWKELTATTHGGYPVLDHIRHLIDGPLVWAPGVDGSVVLSMRGEDFELTVGQDFAVGYDSHDAEKVRLYIEESFTFWLQSAQAAIPLVHRAGSRRGRRPGSNGARSTVLAAPSTISPAIASPVAGALRMPQTLCPVAM